MKQKTVANFGGLALLLFLNAGCDPRANTPNESAASEASAPMQVTTSPEKGGPTKKEMRQISYMTLDRTLRLFLNTGEAKTCDDFVIAMRWNWSRPRKDSVKEFWRGLPPIFLAEQPSSQLPVQTGVVLSGVILNAVVNENAGAAVWTIRRPNGEVVRASLPLELYVHALEDSRAHPHTADFPQPEPHPEGRRICGGANYGGTMPRDPGSLETIPVYQFLMVMDRIH